MPKNIITFLEGVCVEIHKNCPENKIEEIREMMRRPAEEFWSLNGASYVADRGSDENSGRQRLANDTEQHLRTKILNNVRGQLTEQLMEKKRRREAE